MPTVFSKFQKGLRSFKAPTDPGKKDDFEQRMFLTADARVLDEKRMELIREKFDLQFVKMGNQIMLRQMKEEDKVRVGEITTELEDLTYKSFLQRFTKWPFIDDDNKPIALTEENAKSMFPGDDGIEYLNSVLAWAGAERFLKPETGNS